MFENNPAKRYVVSVLVEDKPSALTRVTGLFARRNFNIHALAVGPTNVKGISRITILTDEYNASIHQIANQLQRLIHVLEVTVLDDNKSEEMQNKLADLGNIE
ncbi:MAG: acetolactate synthase small subunit [Candidatus Ancillula sp.]|jgi:acetolactate synthase-1/3 small subunit|nr:acetolactate synthase small subunit [Candidatus Ancillula sp.]